MTAFAEIIHPVQYITELPFSGAAEIGNSGGERIGANRIGRRRLVKPLTNRNKSPGLQCAAGVIEFEQGYHAIVGLDHFGNGLQRDLWMFACTPLAAAVNAKDDQKCGYQEITRLHVTVLMVTNLPNFAKRAYFCSFQP